jgi:4-alpha-glucanotransferase
MRRDELELLHQLANAKGIKLCYQSMDGSQRETSPRALQRVLGSLGVLADNPDQIRTALLNHEQQEWERCIPPALVSWDGKPVRLEIHLRAEQEDKPAKCELLLESGKKKALGVTPAKLRAIRAAEVRGRRFVAKQVMLPALPIGYHELTFASGQTVCRCLLIVAPKQSYSDPNQKRDWGVFLPMYAARSKNDWGAGNFGDWKMLVQGVADRGGGLVASLPLLAAFLDYPVCEPSPYSPASRLFWNDFYVDLSRVPELEISAPARQLINSPLFQAQMTFARREHLINYREQAMHRRKVLELLAKAFFNQPSGRRKQMEAFCRSRPHLEDYAEFRATCDKTKTGWSQWPERMREGKLTPADYALNAKRMHLYAQFIAQEQMNELMTECVQRDVKFYLDLPVGVHPDGYDVWRQSDDFALTANVGAPPDPAFTKGQDWGFSPLHPQRLRENGYDYMLRFLRFQMRHTGMLRIDHVMGLHRLYWIPKGSPASEGAFVTHPADEWLALLSLESHRNKTVLAGENLGTVPLEVDEAMAKHHLRQTYVFQYELHPDSRKAVRPPPKLSVASLNTHDMPTFKAFCDGLDIKDRFDLGLIPKRKLAGEVVARKRLLFALKSFLKREGYLLDPDEGVRPLFEATLRWMAASQAEFVLINLEDLLLEELPQNVPGTCHERPNWRRRMRMSIDEMFRLPEAEKIFAELSRIRKSGASRPKRKQPV